MIDYDLMSCTACTSLTHSLTHLGANDTWTTILEEYMQQIDIMGNNFALSTEREGIGFFSEKQVDMSAFLVQISTYESSVYQWQDAFRFVAPFSSGVWLALFICMIVSALVVYVLDWSFYVERRVEIKHANAAAGKAVVSDKSGSKGVSVSVSVGDEQGPSLVKNFECEKGTTSGDNATCNVSNPTAEGERGERGGGERVVVSDDVDYSDELDISQQISLFDSFYLAFASFTGAESFAPVSKPSKIFVASWSVLVLLLLSTYTANLAATLTKSNAYVEEIQSIEDAIQLGAKTCVSTRNVYYPSLPTSYSNTDELSQLYPFLEVNGLWTDLYEYMKNGTCRLALLNREDINAALQDQAYCDLLVVCITCVEVTLMWLLYPPALFEIILCDLIYISDYLLQLRWAECPTVMEMEPLIVKYSTSAQD
jgi:hypothetical protein